MADLCRLGVGVSAVSGVSAAIGAGTTALLTASSVAGGAVAGPVFTLIAVGATLALDKLAPTRRDQDCAEIMKVALGILAGAAASVAATYLLGFSITVGAVALVDATIIAISVVAVWAFG